MSRMKQTFVAALLTTLLLPAASPTAGQESEGAKALADRFKQLDKNSDGKITTDEVPQSPFFKQRDKNGDGAITLEEIMAALEASTGTSAEAIPVKSQTPSPISGRTPADSVASAVRQGPRPLKAGDHGVGKLVADVSFTDLAGKSQKLSTFAKRKAVVVSMTSSSCPLSKKYLPTLSKLAETYSKRGVTWVLINPVATDKPADMQAAAKSLEGNAIYVHDRDGSLAKAFGAFTTTDVIVLDPARTVVYHGAIDDQYGFGYSIEKPRHRYLAEAIDAVLANKTPLVAATEAPGCTLASASSAPTRATITYHNRISRIVDANCVECHRDGGVGPFPLNTYEDVVAHAGMIKQVVERGIMPPWFAAPHDSPQASVWSNDRSLASADKTDLLAWISSDKPLGDERDAHRSRTFTDGWQIGKPDAIFTFPKPVAVKATGVMPYQNVIVATDLEEDKWVQAIEVRPGDPGVVHHMLVFLQGADVTEDSPVNDAADERQGFWAIYVPGNATLAYRDGFAKRLPKGAKLRFQIHYTPNGTATTDLSRIGVVFAKRPPRHEVRVVGIVNDRITIPPGADNHREEAAIRAPADLRILGFLPHMHLRAKACRFRAYASDGKTRTMLEVPRYDFNWQLLYRYIEPQPLAAGETMKFTVWYDNSANNPANPDPNQTVRWGKQKNDEMHLGYVEFYFPAEKPGE